MRWLILADEWPTPEIYGGVGQWTAAVAAALPGEVTVLARARPGLLDVPGVRVIGVPGRSFGRWGGLWTALGAARLPRPDRVLAATWPPAAWRPWRDVPLDVVFHGSDLTEPLHRRGFAAVTAGARCWAVSRYLADHAAGQGIRASVLPFAVAPSTPRPPSAALGRLVFAGRAVPEKGGDRFVRLVGALGVEGEVIGDGPALSMWRALADSLGARVRFTGALPRPAVLERLRDADLAVLLPRSRPGGGEGLGLALLEAAAVGVPSVGCAVGGVPEACDLVLPAPDDPAASAAAIRAWWTPSRGVAARARLVGAGPEAVAQVLTHS